MRHEISPFGSPAAAGGRAAEGDVGDGGLPKATSGTAALVAGNRIHPWDKPMGVLVFGDRDGFGRIDARLGRQ
jgi:hypothetical protein